MKPTLKGAIALLFLMAFAFFLAGCPDSSKEKNTNGGSVSSQPIKIAANLPLTGPVAAWSGEYPNGFKMGVEDASKDLGVDPATIKVDFQDNAGKAAQAASVVQKQLSEDFDVYISGSSEASMAIAAQVDPTEKPHFIAAFDPFLTSQGQNRLRIMANSKVEAPLFISYAERKKAKSVYVIHLNSGYANDEFGKIIEPTLKNKGIKVISETFEFDTKDYKSIALKAKQANADLIFICGYSFHLLPLIRDLRANGLIKDGRVMGVMDVVDLVHDKTPKSDLQGLVFACPLFDIPGAVPKSAEWTDRYKKRFGRVPSYVPAYAYDTAYAIVKAYKAKGSAKKADIESTLPFEGITGKIELDKDGDIIATVALAQLKADGKVESLPTTIP